jgi:pimeloyl-ACP methyl ester carboxylesterase
MTMPELIRAEVGGHSIAYRRSGQGPALLLLHGFLCDSRVWERQLRDLSDQFTVLAWDAPGAGSSSDPPNPFSITDWANCLAQFLDAVGTARAHVLGLSWGGVLAQEFYRRFPSLVRGLILADTYAGWKGSLSSATCEARLEKCLRESSLLAPEFVSRWVPMEFFTEEVSEDLQAALAAVVSDFHPLGFQLMAKSLADTDTTDLLPQIQVPTLLVWGDHDRSSPLGIAGQFRRAIPNSEMAVIANAGHLSNMEQPEAFNAEVRRFCLAHPLAWGGTRSEQSYGEGDV